MMIPYNTIIIHNTRPSQGESAIMLRLGRFLIEYHHTSFWAIL